MNIDEVFYYKFVGELRLSMLFIVAYGAQFASIAAILVHTLLYDGKNELLFCWKILLKFFD